MKAIFYNLKLRTRINLRMLRNIILFLLLIWLTFFMIFKDQDMNELIRLIKSAKIQYIIIGVFIMFLFYLMEAINIRSILKSFGEKVSLISAIRYTFIGFFFSSITPAASGGQPIEIYYMTKDKIKGANATMALLIQACGLLISTISLGIICAILNPSIFSGWIIPLFLLGVSINSIGLSFLLICIFSKRLTKKIVDIFFKLLKLLRIRSLNAKRKKFDEGLKQYDASAEYIKSHKGLFVISILRVFLQIAVYYSVPFLVYKAFGLEGKNLFHLFTMQAILYCTVSGLPLPGAIGISESVFLTIYGTAFSKEMISGAMLLSRGVTFYLYVIVSLVVVLISMFMTKNRKGEIDKEIIEMEKIEEKEIELELENQAV